MPFDWTHAEFRFRSQRDWQQVPTPSEHHLQLLCPQTQTLMTLYIEKLARKPPDFEKFAHEVLRGQKQLYVEGTRQLVGPEGNANVNIDLEMSEPHVSALAWQVGFEGTQGDRCFVGFLGLVSARKVVNVFVETPISYKPGVKHMYKEVAADFVFALP